jgi:hypothetical protein
MTLLTLRNKIPALDTGLSQVCLVYVSDTLFNIITPSTVFLQTFKIKFLIRFQLNKYTAFLSTLYWVLTTLPPHPSLLSPSRLPLDGFWWNLIFVTFPKIFRENSNLIKFRQKWRVLYMKMFPYFWPYLAKFFLEWETFETKVVDKIKTHILCSITFFRKSHRLWDNVKNIVEIEGTTYDVTIWRIRVACWISKATWTSAHVHARVLARTRTHTQTNK